MKLKCEGGVNRIKINVRDDDRIVEVWLTNGEKANERLKVSLQPLYDEYKQRKYKVAVFQSGNNDLADCTAGLLLHNRML